MATTEAELTFIVAGAPPSALAVLAGRVRSIVPAGAFSGKTLDLQPFLSELAGDAPGHVLVLAHGGGELGLSVKGQLRILKLEASAVLPLPPVLRESSGLSHLLAPRGAPLMFVLDHARLDAANTSRAPHEVRAAVTET